MERYALVRAYKKSGKIDKTMTAWGCAMLQLWALQNTTATKHTFVFSLETGDIKMVCTGVKGSNFPEVEKNPVENIEDICPGILLALNEEVENNAE